MSELYEFKMEDINGEMIDFKQYKNQVLLIVNTASKCGFTPQYHGLQELYESFKGEGFFVLGFPCDQFMHQEFDTSREIKNFCQENYQITFPLFQKIEVNGDGEHPLYTFLKKGKGGIFGSKIKWNFTKFLIDRQGNVVERYGPQNKPENLKEDIIALL